MDRYKETVKLWQSYNIQTESDLDLRLDSFRVLFAYHSGKIENPEIDYHDTREIFENGRVVNFTGNPRTLFEQENQKTCYEFLKPRIVAREPLTTGLIREIHGILTAGTYDETRYLERGERPGAYKKHDYVIGLAEVGAPPEDVPREMEEMLAVMNESGEKDSLKVGTYLHARFEYIHPFADGNGRVGRTILNYYLMTHNHPPLIVYDEDRRGYYKALEAYDREEDLTALYEFLVAETCKTWEKTLQVDKSRRTER